MSTEAWTILSLVGAISVMGIALLVIFHSTELVDLRWSNFRVPWKKKEEDKGNDS